MGAAAVVIMIEARTLILSRLRQRQATTTGAPLSWDPPLGGVSGQPLDLGDPCCWANRFVTQARALGTEVHLVGERATVPTSLHLVLAPWSDEAMVAWPALRPWLENEFPDLAFRGALDHDRLGITGCMGAIAETGSLLLTTGVDTPNSVSLLPEIHIALVSQADIVPDLESAWLHLQSRPDWPPRGVTLVSGPSRTADIEQQVVIGAHGPARVIVLLYPA